MGLHHGGVKERSVAEHRRLQIKGGVFALRCYRTAQGRGLVVQAAHAFRFDPVLSLAA